MDAGEHDERMQDDRISAEELADYDLGGETGGADEPVGDPFFVSRKAAAVFKHSLLKNYFPKFAGKVGSTEPDKRLVYVDTHAGPGAYDDGTPGSPMLIAQNVTGMLGASGAAHRKIACMFIEARRSSHSHLRRVLEQKMPAEADWKVQYGKASDHLDDALNFAANAPLFMFIDPYGLGPSFSEVVRVLSRPRNGYGSKTEVLLNFISMAFSRAGGFLKAEKPSSQQLATLDRLDKVLGDGSWRQVYLSAPSPGRAVDLLVEEYACRVCATVNGAPRAAPNQECQATLIPVRNTLDQDCPVYWLLHFTFHPHGRWCIAEAAAKASADWRKTNHQLTLNKRMAREAMAAQTDLFGGKLVPQVTAEEHLRIEQQLQREWIDTIETNLSQLISARGQLKVCEDMEAIFGTTLGFAYQKHLNKAWDRLAECGLVSPRDTKKAIEKQIIRRA